MRHPIALALGLLLFVGTFAHAGEDFSAHELPPDGPIVRYVTDSQRPLWPGGVVDYYYNPAGQPADISTATMELLIQTAGRKWENLCKVRFNYLGTTTAAPNLSATFSTIDRRSVIGWAALTGNKAGFDGYTAWWYQFTSGSPQLVDADVVINTTGNTRFSARNLASLASLMTHEMGHMLALQHSDKQQSVMYANPYNPYSFQATLRGDDAAACASLYGASAQASANRVFNWAEQTLPQLFAPTGVASVDGFGFHYRHFSGSGSYLGLQGDQIWYLPPGGTASPVGTVQQFLNQAQQAGF